MKRMRMRHLLVCVVIADATLVLGGVPLQQYSWSVALQADPDTNLVLLLIAANIGLLVIAACGLFASMALARRGVPLALRHVARFFVRPSRV